METHPKTFVITGATSGIGLATSELLIREGFDVIGVSRSPERGLAAKNVLQSLNPAVSVEYLSTDLSVQSQVRGLAAEIKDLLNARGKTWLDGLVNNAGVFTYWLTLTPEGVEQQWAVNHLAGFLLTHELLGQLQAAPQGRVVTVSSGSHYGARIPWADPQLRRHYNGLRMYGITKLANVLFTLELSRRLGADSSLRAFAVDPGLVKTDMGLKHNPGIARLVWKIRRSSGTDASVPARCIVNLLTRPEFQQESAIYWKDSRPKTESAAARDSDSARRLWLTSEKLCGLNGGSHEPQ
jgi:NAD(P)-dependent dehydrogenase (short-subunit alcohol dehydrogenase family)